MSNLPVYQQAFLAYFMGRAMLSGPTDPGDPGDCGDGGDIFLPPTTSWETWQDVTDTVDQMFPPTKASSRQRISMPFFRTMLRFLMYGMLVPATTAVPEVFLERVPDTEISLHRKVYLSQVDGLVDGKDYRWTDVDLLGMRYCFHADEISWSPESVGMALSTPQPNVCAIFDRQLGSWLWVSDSDLAYTYKNREHTADMEYWDPSIVCYDEENHHIEPMQSTRCSVHLDRQLCDIRHIVGSFGFLGVSCMVMSTLLRKRCGRGRQRETEGGGMLLQW